jgi:hypothetical protein
MGRGTTRAFALGAVLLSGAPLHAQSDFSAARPAAGAWAYRPDANGSEAAFVAATGGVQLSLRCIRATRGVILSRISAAPASSLGVWASSQVRTLPARFDQAGMRVSATLSASDPLLDAIAFSRGRFAVTMPGSVPLVLPPSPEAARVFEDCRS